MSFVTVKLELTSKADMENMFTFAMLPLFSMVVLRPPA